MGEMDEVVDEFLVESFENLDRMDDDLLALERVPHDVETIASIFRSIHTIKGTCGFLGFGRLERVTHVGENLLGRLRDGELAVTEEITSALLATNDAVRGMLSAIETTGVDGEEEHVELIETLTRLCEPPPAGPSTDQRLGEILVASGDAAPEAVEAATAQQDRGDERRIGQILIDQNAVSPIDVVEALDKQQEARTGIGDTSIRVDVGLLDHLMNLVGELVLARNQIMQLDATREGTGFGAVSQRVKHITSELQEGVMKTRMQPIGNVWSKLPRVVRDLSLQCGKQVRVEMKGQETELDKTIIEAIKDPLTHLVRNSVDHGIEEADDRVAAGKPTEGRLSLRAFHEGGQVNIEIADDGAGIDAARLAAKAVERGLITADQAQRMGEREALHLVFAPGFSTAAEVTNVSGRGVGMDVVRTNIERIGGTIDLSTKPGQGTTFRIRIPLTLAIVPALIISAGAERFAIPQLSVVELVRLDGEQARTGVEHVQGAPVLRLRGRLLPLVRLRQELGMASSEGDHSLNIVVLQTDGQQFGLIVDAVHDTQEIVVKPLGRQVKDLPVYAGATIMGDGRVALILDAAGLGQRAGAVSGHRDGPAGSSEDDRDETVEETTAMLIVELGAGHRAALPLAEVDRLEAFDPTTIEQSHRGSVVQYRGGIMPLVALAEVLGLPEVHGRDGGTLDVVVHSRGGRHIGLLVNRISDIVEERLVVHGASGRAGIFGSAVVAGNVTDVLDIDQVLAITGLHEPPADAVPTEGEAA